MRHTYARSDPVPTPPPAAPSSTASGSATPSAAPPAVPAGPTINIGDEFGTAKRNLPPARIVLITIGAVLVVVLVTSFFKRAKPQGAGSLDNVAAAEIPDQGSTMVALTFTFRNTSEQDLVVRSLHGRVKTSAGELTADAVSAVDFDRYFQAFPSLKNGALPALPPETRIHPGEALMRTIIVVFPITQDAFNQRQSTSVVVQPYDQQLPVVLTR
jgi:hypothetical protein